MRQFASSSRNSDFVFEPCVAGTAEQTKEEELARTYHIRLRLSLTTQLYDRRGQSARG
jgi:hypothetical protein